ncbi:MAG: GH92 family glycosyl hydrolase [Muribaculaceae bacterium]|nr:GH92 family glycosyl hydrolase [Muribaculaceae bacterium]
MSCRRSKAVAFAACAVLWVYAAEDYTTFVNPLMGTMSSYELSAGNTYPAIARPWGMNFWTPQTGVMGDGWQYTYDAHRIRGFKQTHQPSPWINDYGQFSLMPVTKNPVFEESERASWFSHKAEQATPYYYSVYLADHDVLAEMTPTERAAAFRFTFPEGESYVVIDAFDCGSEVNISADGRKVSGRTTRNSGGVPANFANYFVVEFDKPVSYVATFGKAVKGDSLILKAGSEEFSGFHAGAVIGFNTERREQVMVRVASSFISAEQAELNLKELDGRDFESLVSEGKEVWNNVLGRLAVNDTEADNLDRKRTFYSCLYRSTLFPRKFYEINSEGQPVHYSPYSGEVLPGYMYTDTGFWDTFRCLFPLLNLVYPSVSHEMQEGFLNAWRESGFFPEWCSPGHRGCMVGNNSASVMADAWLKGICVSDPEALWRGVISGANSVHPTVSSTGRLGWEEYNKLGYVPCDIGINESAARTLEYAYDDWCIYRLGKALGRPERELAQYKRNALNYKNLYSHEFQLMRGRRADGSFADPFSPLKWGDVFTEGNAWHYTWSVFHDPAGLISLMGGNDNFVAQLDSMFTIPPLFDDSYYGFPIHEIREMTVMNMGNYAHGNQPVQHAIYLYDWALQPWKGQFWLRRTMDSLYSPVPDGYCGDEDNGQTSAWYVFSALGFYPVAPGSNQYAIGSPLFRNVSIRLENGNIVNISAPANSETTPYVDKLTLDGAVIDRNYLAHDELIGGCDIDFTMSAVPNTVRGTSSTSAPYSFSNQK